MTEEEWLTTTNPYDLTHYKACRSDRKRRLLSCAFVRQVLHLLPDDGYRLAVETCERFADGLVKWKDMLAARKFLTKAWPTTQREEAVNCAWQAAWLSLDKQAVLSVHAWEHAAFARASLARPDWDTGYDEAKRAALLLIRDIFGNPFRPVTLDQAWLTPTVKQLATASYLERAFNLMPILADALEEAGCDNPAILTHCRQPGDHVRGCWVVDVVLGKK
jgi:hypothetical protein